MASETLESTNAMVVTADSCKGSPYCIIRFEFNGDGDSVSVDHIHFAFIVCTYLGFAELR